MCNLFAEHVSKKNNSWQNNVKILLKSHFCGTTFALGLCEKLLFFETPLTSIFLKERKSRDF